MFITGGKWSINNDKIKMIQNYNDQITFLLSELNQPQ